MPTLTTLAMIVECREWNTDHWYRCSNKVYTDYDLADAFIDSVIGLVRADYRLIEAMVDVADPTRYELVEVYEIRCRARA